MGKRRKVSKADEVAKRVTELFDRECSALSLDDYDDVIDKVGAHVEGARQCRRAERLRDGDED